MFKSLIRRSKYPHRRRPRFPRADRHPDGSAESSRWDILCERHGRYPAKTGELQRADKEHVFLQLDTLSVCLAVSREHPFAHKRGITRKELEGERLLVLSPRLSPAAMNWTAQAFEGVVPPVFVPVENTASQLMRVCHNHGMAILFPSMARGYDRQLTLLPIWDFPQEAYRLAMYRPQKVSGTTRKFLEYLAGAFARDGEENSGNP